MLTHMPSRARCPWCGTGRARASQHRRIRGEGEDHVSALATGDCFIIEASTPVLCRKCARTGVAAAHAVRSKDVSPELVRLVVKDIDNMGHTRVMVKSDNEPAMKAFARRIRELRVRRTVAGESP